jgi:hypothetical protein
MKLLLCVALLFGGCSTPIKSHKKLDNIIKQEDLQEKFDEIDQNKDGVIDKSEARKHEETKPARTDPEAPMWAFFQILAFMAMACIVTWTCTFAAGKISDFRQKKRV